MANESYYFDHDYDARNDDKILEMRSVYKAEGYGVFWMILETMAVNENGGVNTSLIVGLSLGYGVPKDWLVNFINFCVSIKLFIEKEGVIYSNRMLGHKDLMKSYSEYGKKGAEKRWGGYRGANGDGNGGGNAKERKERKEKKEERGVSFSADGLDVVFSDGSSQRLGMSQSQRYKEGNYQPHYIFKGKIE